MHEFHSNLKQPRFRRFTLVELMAAIVIIAIILAITAPAFTRLMTGSSVDTGTTMLSAQLSLARAEAASRRCKIAIVIYDVEVPTSFRAAWHTGGNWEWLPGSKVEELPLGAVMVRFSSGMPLLTEVDDIPTAFNTVKGLVTNPATLPADYEITLDGITYPAMIFGANGRALKPYYLVIVEGVVQKVGPDIQLQKANLDNARILKVSPFTGRVSYEKNPRLP